MSLVAVLIVFGDRVDPDGARAWIDGPRSGRGIEANGGPRRQQLGLADGTLIDLPGSGSRECRAGAWCGAIFHGQQARFAPVEIVYLPRLRWSACSPLRYAVDMSQTISLDASSREADASK